MSEVNEQETMLHIRGVNSFHSSYGVNADPHCYPGERPSTSFVTDGNEVLPVRVQDGGAIELHTQEGWNDVNSWLAAHGVVSLADRIPVVSYGANLCPPTLRKKLEYDGRPDLKIVPTIYGWVDGIDMVWHESPSQRGSFFAELYNGHEVRDTSLQVGTSFLTPEQLLFLHKTEPNYDFGRFSQVRITDQLSVPAFLYAGSSQVLLRDGQPVGVEGVARQNPSLPTDTSHSMLAYVLSFNSIRQRAAELLGVPKTELDVTTYTEHAMGMSVKDKRTTAAAMKQAVCVKPGLSANYSMVNKLDHRFSWANPSLIPTYGELRQGATSDKLIRLPEQELRRADLSDKALDQRQVILDAVRRHWRARRS
jgi:hypothetical protein